MKKRGIEGRLRIVPKVLDGEMIMIDFGKMIMILKVWIRYRRFVLKICLLQCSTYIFLL